MKLHTGGCTGAPCSRAHGYKCREDGTWFPQVVIEVPSQSDRVSFTQWASPYYPYCSRQCAAMAQLHDPGFHIFETAVLWSLSLDAEAEGFPISPEDHKEFNNTLSLRSD